MPRKYSEVVYADVYDKIIQLHKQGYCITDFGRSCLLKIAHYKRKGKIDTFWANKLTDILRARKVIYKPNRENKGASDSIDRLPRVYKHPDMPSYNDANAIVGHKQRWS